jgi:hypothetical protein
METFDEAVEYVRKFAPGLISRAQNNPRSFAELEADTQVSPTKLEVQARLLNPDCASMAIRAIPGFLQEARLRSVLIRVIRG